MKSRPKILVVGSINVDLTVSTDVFPKEGETVSGNGFRKAAGGKGANQAVQLARLGADVTMVGAVGDDTDGCEMRELLCRERIDTNKITVKESMPTGCAVIVLHGAKNRIIVYAGANGAIKLSDVEFLENKISEYDMVVLQLEVPMEINEAVAKYARKCGVPVFLNTAPYAPISDALLSCITYLSPNETETESMTGVTVANLEDANKAASSIVARGVNNVVITLGAKGAYCYGENGEFYSPAVKDVAAVDTTGAGDSFIGGFCYSVCTGATVEEALRFANHTAAVTVSRMGAIPSLPTLQDVLEMLNK